jgi:hypothetical protein
MHSSKREWHEAHAEIFELNGEGFGDSFNDNDATFYLPPPRIDLGLSFCFTNAFLYPEANGKTCVDFLIPQQKWRMNS